jgi:hypothetical protein
MSRAPRRRKCLCCSQLFLPDPRTVDRQRYCSLPACRLVSKAASQRRWLSKDGNGDTFRGPDQVRRVQEWRRAHPGYWKRNKPRPAGTQPVADQSANPDQSSCNAPGSPLLALQDDWISQAPAFVGLISMVTGSTLQEDIAATTRQVLLRGRNILGLTPAIPADPGPSLTEPHDPQTSPTPGTPAADPTELQLG